MFTYICSAANLHYGLQQVFALCCMMSYVQPATANGSACKCMHVAKIDKYPQTYPNEHVAGMIAMKFREGIVESFPDQVELVTGLWEDRIEQFLAMCYVEELVGL